MRFIVVTCCALVVVKSASIRDKFIVTPQNLSSPSENLVFSSQKVKLLNRNTETDQAVRPLRQNGNKLINKLKAEEVIYTGLARIRNEIESGGEKVSNDFWRGLNSSVQEFVRKHKNSNEFGSEFQHFIQEKVKNQQGFGQSIINFFTEGVSNIVNNLAGAPQQPPVSNIPEAAQPLDDVEIETSTQKPNFLSNVVNSVQQVFQPPQRPQQAQPQQAQSQASVPPQPLQPQTSSQPAQDAPSTQRPNFISNVVNSVQQAFKPPQQVQQASFQQVQPQVSVQQVQHTANTQIFHDIAPTSTDRPNFLTNVANSVQQAFKPPQQAQPQQVPVLQVQLQVPIQPVQPLSNIQQTQGAPIQPAQSLQNNQQLQDDSTSSTQRPNFLSNVVNSVQQAFKPQQQAQPQQAQSQQAQPQQTSSQQARPQHIQTQVSARPTQPPPPAQSTNTERPGFLSNVVGQVQQAFQRPQQVTQAPQVQQIQAVQAETTTYPSPGVDTPPSTTTTTQTSLLQNIGQVIQGFRPQQAQSTPAQQQVQETTATAVTLAPNIIQNIGNAIQSLRPQPSQVTTTSTPAPQTQSNQVQQVVASSSQIPSSQSNNLQIAIAEVAACIVKTRIDNLVEYSKHKISGDILYK